MSKSYCRTVETAKPKIIDDTDVILKVTGSTVCGSDLHLLHGMFRFVAYVPVHNCYFALGMTVDISSGPICSRYSRAPEGRYSGPRVLWCC
jgi:hypothetical protein